ncbi:MAG: hypothetical protein WD080_03415 [Egibacteraceae bacterium]
MRAAFDIAVRDLRARLRDRSALITAFVAPLGLAVILSLALGSTGGVSVTIALADEDGDRIGQAITGALGADVFTVVEVADAASVRTAVRDD